MCIGVDTQDNRSIKDEMYQTTQAELQNAPATFALESQYRPQYAAMDQGEWQKTLLGTPATTGTGLYGQFAAPATRGLLDILENDYAPAMNRINDASSLAASERQRQGDLAQRTADISDVERLGPAAVAAIRGANPEQTALMAGLNARAQVGYNDPQTALLAQQAQGELDQGAMIDPAQARQFQQTMRAQQAARGFGYGTNDMANEAVYTAQQANALRDQRRAFAQQAMAANGNQFQQNAQFQGQVAGLNATTQQDPFLAILGRQGANVNAGQALGAQAFVGSNAGMGANSQPQIFNPQSPYAQDLYQTNYGGQLQAKISEAANKTAIYTGLIKSVGDTVSCWVAREVFGETNPQWREFREWLTKRAPRWFKRLYMRHGEWFARWIKDKPRVKRIVRRWMEKRIVTAKNTESAERETKYVL